MKVLKEIKEYKNSSGKNERFLCWECDKCGGMGFMAIGDAVTEIPEDQKKCCEEK